MKERWTFIYPSWRRSSYCVCGARKSVWMPMKFLTDMLFEGCFWNQSSTSEAWISLFDGIGLNKKHWWNLCSYFKAQIHILRNLKPCLYFFQKQFFPFLPLPPNIIVSYIFRVWDEKGREVFLGGWFVGIFWCLFCFVLNFTMQYS